MPIQYKGSVYVEAQPATLETAAKQLEDAEMALKLALRSVDNKRALLTTLNTVEALLRRGKQTVKDCMRREKAAEDAAVEAPRRY
jgi:cell division protein ZapA (FtsZ GTPase activity inhibitor)